MIPNDSLPHLVPIGSKDRYYTTQLKVPEGGLTLKTRIFVEVKATNLTGRYEYSKSGLKKTWSFKQ